MATVPQYGDNTPQVRETPVSDPLSSPEDFGAGAGRQLQQLGGAVIDASNVGSDILIRMQEHKNMQAVMSAETALADAETTYLEAMRKRRGVDAEGVVEDTVKFYEEQNAAIQGTLQNTVQRDAFAKSYTQRRISALRQASQYADAQMRQATADAAEASVAATIENGIASPGAADENTATIQRTYRALGHQSGWAKEVTDGKINAALTKMHVGVIGSLVDDNPGAARAYYKEYEDQINPSARERVKDALRAGETKGFSQRKATEIMAKYEDPAEQLRVARETIKDPTRQEATVSQIKTRQAENKAFKTQRENEAYDTALRMTQASDSGISSYDDLPIDLRDTMSGAQQAQLSTFLTERTNKALKGRTVDDPDKLREVEDMVRAGRVTTIEQVRQYDPYLTDDSVSRLEKAVEKAGEIPQSDLLKEFEIRKGDKYADWYDDDDTAAEWKAFQDYAYSAGRAGAYTRKDIRELADDFFMDNVIPNYYVGTFDKDTTLGETLVDDPQILTRATDLMRRSGVEVAPTDIPRAMRYLSKNGIQISSENITAVTYLLSKGLPVNAANIQEIAKQYDGR